MNNNWWVVLGAAVIIVAAVTLSQPSPNPQPPPPTSSTTAKATTTSVPPGTSVVEPVPTTTTTTPPPQPDLSLSRMTVPAPDGTCERLNQAVSGELITLDHGHLSDLTNGGVSKDYACDVRGQQAPGVTVTGSYTGDLWCHGCDGWVFDGVTVKPGSLRMIGGQGWTIRNTTIHGGNRGLMSVLGTGATDSTSVTTKSPANWLMDHVDSGGAGCREATDTAFPTHVRALYINGANGKPNNGVIQNSHFWGARCGYTVKIGTTGNFGVLDNSADAADAVTFRNNVVEQLAIEPPAEHQRQEVPLLVSGDSDNVTVTGNQVLGRGAYALAASGPFTGSGFVFTNNKFAQTLMIQWRRYKPLFYPYGGEEFVKYAGDPCSSLGTCAGNVKVPA